MRIAPLALALTLPLQALAADSISLLAGNKQAVRRAGPQVPGGIAAFEPLAVVVKGPDGKPAAGVTVAFECGPRPPAMVCQLESFDAANGDNEPAPAQLTPSGWTTTRGQLVATVEGAASARAGAANILNAVPVTKVPAARVVTDENGVARLSRLAGKAVWAYGADGELVVTAACAGCAPIEFRLTVRK
jgi:hypothetical protein